MSGVSIASGVVATDGSGGITSLTGDVTGSGTGAVATTLATVNSNVGSFTNANVTVNAKGLVTAASNGSGAAAAGVTGSIQFNAANVLAGSANLKWDSAFDEIDILSNVEGGGNVSVKGAFASGSPNGFYAARSRGTIAAPVALINNDIISGFYANGYDGADFSSGGGFDCYVDGAFVAGALLIATEFYCGSGGVGLTLRGNKNLEVGGNLIMASTKAVQLGNAAATGLAAGVLAALTNASVVLKDSTGQAYRIPCII